MRLLRAHAGIRRRLRPVAALSALGGIALLAAACSGEPDIVVRPAATPSATATATSTATPTPTATATSEPAEVITTVKDFVSRYGYPAGSDFAELRIPTIGVDTRVGARTVGRDAVMPAPAGPADVVWYDLDLWEGLGGTPGGGHNAVFSGHVDYADTVPFAHAAYRGQAVFSQLHLLSQGDVIEVIYQGETLRYSVEWRQQLTAGDETDWASIWSADTEEDAITLYTCGGSFDFTTREYEDRVIVRAHRI